MGGGARIQSNITIVNIVDPIDGREKANAGLEAIGPAFFQQPIVESLPVSYPVAVLIERKHRNDNEVDLSGIHEPAVDRLGDIPPRSFDQTILAVHDGFQLTRPRDNSRCRRDDVWPAIP